MGRIRRALSDSPGRRGGETPVLERSQPLRSADEGLAGQFRVEMEKLGGRVVDTGSLDQINEYIGALVVGCKSVAVSDEISARWPGISDQIRGRGIEIVPALREFAAPAKREMACDTSQPEAGQESLFGDAGRVPAAGESAGNGVNGSASGLMERYKLSLFDAAVGITTAD